MTSDQSVTSTSSRVRQFGLYRTIDARTEEFLRLSRKWQVRQGCACAAISTAITVTIIVSILLVFELNFNLHDDHNRVQDWRGLVNNTAEDTIYNNVYGHIDKITLKLLPILFKALNKDKLISKFLDVYTTSQPMHERKHTTEFTYKKNVFTDLNNWIRFPSSRLVAFEYKTSPVVYFKTPKNDYFTKIRKIRDYERIMNYVDKMISDRVTFGSTQPMKRSYDYTPDETQTQKTITTPLIRDYKGDSLTSRMISDTPNKIDKNEKENICKCPKKINEILNNLIKNIKLLMPNYESTESIFLATKIDDSVNLKQFNFDQNGQTIIQTETPSTVSASVSDLNVNEPEQYEPAKLNQLKRDQALKTLVNLLQPKFMGQKIYSFKGHAKYTTTLPAYIDRTETNQETTTAPIPRQNFAKHDPLHLITTAADYSFINKVNYHKRIPSEPDYKEGGKENNLFTTSNTVDNYSNLDAHSLELVKRRLISSCKKTKENATRKPNGIVKNKELKNMPDKRQYSIQSKPPVDTTKTIQQHSTTIVHYLYNSHNKPIKINSPMTIRNAELTTITTKKPFISFFTSSSPDITYTTEKNTVADFTSASTSTSMDDLNYIFKTKFESKSNKNALDLKFKDDIFRSEELASEDDIDKIMIEENYQENDYKEGRIDYTTSRTSHEPSEKKKVLSKQIETKDKDDFFFTSMALHNKPRSYQEIQKNDMKNDDNYNLNLNHLFD